jgi:threonine-phosphate decarboxylase
LNKHGGNISEASRIFNVPQRRIIDFSASINPMGISPEIYKAVSCAIKSVADYPDPDNTEVRETLSDYLGVKPCNILAGNGSTELIYAICRALSPAKVIIPVPSFSEYERAVKVSGGHCVFLKCYEKNGFSYDITEILSNIPKCDMVIVCNPNNPSGCLTAKKDLILLEKKCRKHKVMLVIDEAFIDFAGDIDSSMVKAAYNNPYLIVVRSLTKYFAIPGLRAGYIIGHERTIRQIQKYHYPWSMNILAQKAVIAGIKDPLYIKQTLTLVENEKKYLSQKMNETGFFQTYPSSANFILVKLLSKSLTAGRLADMLGRKGILIRDCSNFRGLNIMYIRIAVRTRVENNRLLDALQKVLKKEKIY